VYRSEAIFEFYAFECGVTYFCIAEVAIDEGAVDEIDVCEIGV
jgi:hypothetical protein